MPSEPPRRVLLRASVHPAAALWLLRRVAGGEGAADIRKSAEAFERSGQPGHAAALRDAWAQLQQAAAQLTTDDLLPRIGSSEVVGSEMAAQSGHVVASLVMSTTVAYAAGLLGAKPRQFINLIHDGVLIATHDGRGRTWRVDPQSLQDLLDVRNAR